MNEEYLIFTIFPSVISPAEMNAELAKVSHLLNEGGGRLVSTASTTACIIYIVAVKKQ